MKEIFVLGAEDPEMVRIGEVLDDAGKACMHAKKDGQRVHPGNAYEANNGDDIPDGANVIFVECEIAGTNPKLRIDHHRPGDSGYDKNAEQYWEAASLGQLHTYLGTTPTLRDFTLAAMDHCPSAALKGQCPGVSADAVLYVKLEEIAKATARSIDEVREKVVYFRQALGICETILMGDQNVHNVRENTGIGYTLAYLSAQVAAWLSGSAVILHLYNEEGGPERLHLCGDVNEDTAVYFMETWVPENGLTNIYGVPSRGYAGGYKQ